MLRHATLLQLHMSLRERVRHVKLHVHEPQTAG